MAVVHANELTKILDIKDKYKQHREFALLVEINEYNFSDMLSISDFLFENKIVRFEKYPDNVIGIDSAKEETYK